MAGSTELGRVGQGSKRRALIVGGSMSGLLAALLLRRAGWDADIFERVESELSGRGRLPTCDVGIRSTLGFIAGVRFGPAFLVAGNLERTRTLTQCFWNGDRVNDDLLQVRTVHRRKIHVSRFDIGEKLRVPQHAGERCA